MSAKITALTICLGSSCFARGNKRTVSLIQDYLKQNGLEARVHFKGNHCFGKCNKGPVLQIDEQIFEGVTERSLREILDRELRRFEGGTNLKALVNISEKKCKVCYACVRACPVNAIQVRADQLVPRIMPNRCIGCGSCIAACKPSAIDYLDSKEETRKLLSDKGLTVAVIVDPTIAAEFPDITDYRKFVSMLRELGFRYVNEVSFGADLIAAEYARLLKDFRGKYYIMANDPVSIGYIEKFQPGLIPNLAPLVSPAIATAKVVTTEIWL